ncbi:hypothetical protein HK102_000491 [Quaeritorhiza haematococci]|nr:hypothetical protein HK102_000491 [Quaeritorhiza haematococci]
MTRLDERLARRQLADDLIARHRGDGKSKSSNYLESGVPGSGIRSGNSGTVSVSGSSRGSSSTSSDMDFRSNFGGSSNGGFMTSATPFPSTIESSASDDGEKDLAALFMGQRMWGGGGSLAMSRMLYGGRDDDDDDDVSVSTTESAPLESNSNNANSPSAAPPSQPAVSSQPVNPSPQVVPAPAPAVTSQPANPAPQNMPAPTLATPVAPVSTRDNHESHQLPTVAPQAPSIQPPSNQVQASPSKEPSKKEPEQAKSSSRSDITKENRPASGGKSESHQVSKEASSGSKGERGAAVIILNEASDGSDSSYETLSEKSAAKSRKSDKGSSDADLDAKSEPVERTSNKGRPRTNSNGNKPLRSDYPVADLYRKIAKERKWKREEVEEDLETLAQNRLRTVDDLRVLSADGWKEIRGLLPVVKDLLRDAAAA